MGFTRVRQECYTVSVKDKLLVYFTRHVFQKVKGIKKLLNITYIKNAIRNLCIHITQGVYLILTGWVQIILLLEKYLDKVMTYVSKLHTLGFKETTLNKL